MRVAPLLLVASLAAGCASHPGTRPIEGRRRLTSAQYDLAIQGRPIAHVKVWSLGPPRGQDGPDAAAHGLEVHMRVRNDTDAPLRLDARAAKLEVRTEHDPVLIVDGPSRVAGTPVVPPGGLEWVALTFELPSRASLEEVTGYELMWSLETAVGRISRTTTFVGEPREEDAGYFYYPSSYPFYGIGLMPFGYGGTLAPGPGYYGYWW